MSEQELLEESIVALNRLKIKKPSLTLCEKINDLQQTLEDKAGVSAVELDDRYDQ